MEEQQIKPWVSLFLVLLLIGFLYKFFGYTEGKRYGEPISPVEATTIADVIMLGGNFAGKQVKVEGKIVSESPVGTWFVVYDGTGSLYVDLNPAGLGIPQAVKKSVVVEGIISLGEEGPTLIGHGIYIK
jgi:hypothetical protein